jgi:predicted acetyltransferase
MASLPGGLEMRPISSSEVPIFAGLVERAFGGSRLSDTEISNRRGILEPARTLAAFDRGELVATLAAHGFSMSVPGGQVGMGGIGHVSVRADYSRRGLMTSMMTTALRQVREQGEPVSALWPSEAPIYGRFGYGLASRSASLSIDGRPDVTRQESPGEIRLIPDASTADTALLDRLFRSSCAVRPGMIVRSAERWRQRLAPREDGYGGTAYVICALHVDGENADGYALYLTRPDWGPGRLPNGVTTVIEVCAQTADALASLWGHVLSADMMATTIAPIIPADDPGLWTLRDTRRWQTRLTDNLWVRLTDVPAALRARTYARDIDVVLELEDNLFPENSGRYRLAGDSTGASCDPTTAPADLMVTAGQLGASYLGSTSLASLALTPGLEEKTKGALLTAATAFSAPLAACCIDPF